MSKIKITLAPAQRDILQHSLGIQKRGSKWTNPYRNYFCTGPGTSDFPLIMELVNLGLMRESHTINDGKDTIYTVTNEGRELIGAFS